MQTPGICFFLILFFFPQILDAQNNTPAGNEQTTDRFTLPNVLLLAEQQSIDAVLYRHRFLTAYWQFRSHRAELLPSLNLSLVTPDFSRALVPLQNPETGEYKYIEQYSMRNSATVSINQNVAATGGTLSLYSSLERLDQYKPDRYHLYNTNPVSITYTQPIWGSINRLKWDKKIEPEKYEKAKYEYLEGMEAVKIKAVTLFFDLLSAQQNLEKARTNFGNTEKSWQIAQRRFEIGTITKNDLMQLELRMLNDQLSISGYEIAFKTARFKLASFLGLQENYDFNLIVPEQIPDLILDYSQIYSLAVDNTSFKLDKKIRRLEAEMSVAQAKANRGWSASLFAQFGLNQSAEKLGDSYKDLREMENVQVGIRFPLVDWGMGRGRVKMQESRMNVVNTQIEQELLDHQQDLIIKVLQFNNQKEKCRIAEKAYTIALERYGLSLESFGKGTLSVLEFNTAQSEKDAAMANYIGELSNYWYYYYLLQQTTLYDFRNNRNISADFDVLVNQ